MAEPVSPVAPISAARNRLWLPRAALTSCVRAALLRDTRGLALSDWQRFTHLPAGGFCAITWWFEGEIEALPPGLPVDLATPRQRPPGPHPLGRPVLLSGPHTQPTVYWSPGPSHALMLVLMPDALHALTGVATERLVNGLVHAAAVLPADWVAMCGAVLQAADDDARLALIEDFLAPRWRAARPRQGLAAQQVGDWVQALALRAATSPAGRSLRQVERRIKRWAGLSLREAKALSRAERAFVLGMAAHRAGPVNWAEMAGDLGYADQSHLCRVTRRVTGFAPEELRRLVDSDERLWAYRLWA